MIRYNAKIMNEAEMKLRSMNGSFDDIAGYVVLENEADGSGNATRLQMLDDYRQTLIMKYGLNDESGLMSWLTETIGLAQSGVKTLILERMRAR